MADRSLTLGTIFTGHMDATFMRTTRRLRSLLTQLNATMGGTVAATDKLARSTKTGGVAVAGTNKRVKKGADEMGIYGKSIGKVTGGIQRLTAAMKVTASYGLAATAIFGVINAMKEGVKAIFDYDQALKNLQAITGATEVEVSLMGDTVKDVAQKTKFSAKEVSDAMILLGQAGFTAAESMDAIQAVAVLATGTLTNMAVSADLMTTAIRAFNLQASDASRVADIFASAVNRSKLTIDKIKTAFNFLAPLAFKVGLSLEETASSMMILANAGLRASTIGTGMRQVLARLVAPSSKLQEAFADAGVDLDKLNIKVHGLANVIEELTKVIPDAGTAFRLFGLRGAPVVAVLTTLGKEGFEKMFKEVMRSGVAMQMAEKQMEGLGVMAKNLSDKIGILAVTVGEGGLAAAFRLLLNVLRPAVDIMIILADNILGRMIITAVGVTAAITALSLALRFMVIQLGAVAAGQTVAALKAILVARNMGLIKLAVVSLHAAFIKLGFFLAINPWIKWIAIIGGAIVVTKTIIDAVKEHGQALEKESIARQKNIKTLNDYIKKLGEVEDGSVEHTSIIGQLVQKYPQLTAVLYDSTASLEDHRGELEKLLKTEKEFAKPVIIDAARDKAKELIKLVKALEKYEEKARKLGELDPFTRDILGINLEQSGKKISVLTGEIGDLEIAIGKMSKFIREEFGEEIDFGIKIDKNWIDLLEKAEKAARDAEKQARVFLQMGPGAQFFEQFLLLKQLGQDWVDYYNSLDELRKIDVLKERVAVDRKLTQLRESQEALKLNAKQLAIAEAQITAEGLVKVIASHESAGNKIYDSRLKIARKLINDLVSEEKRLAKEIRGINVEIQNIHESTADIIHGLERETLSDRQKWFADERRLREIEALARQAWAARDFEEARRLYLKARDEAAKLAREVKGADDKILVTRKQNTERAIQLVKGYSNSAILAAEQEGRAKKKQLDFIKTSIKTAEELLNSFGLKVKEVNKLELTLNTDPVKVALNAVIGQLEKIKEKMKSLKNATVQGISFGLNSTFPTAATPVPVTSGVAPGGSGVQTFEPGGSVRTFNLNINGSEHQFFGTDTMIKKFDDTLRREELTSGE